MAQTESRKKASLKYKQKNIKRIPFDMQMDEYERMKEHTEELKIPINTYLKELVRKDLGKELGEE